MSRFILAWKSVKWPNVIFRVRKLQRRIYKAKSLNQISKVHWLQKKLIGSYDAKLFAVYQVTTLNKSPRKEKIKFTPEKKKSLAIHLSMNGKADKESTINDQAKQALAKLALEPEWEAVFEANSYGFRPGRSAQDTTESIFLALRHGTPKWVFGGDVKECLSNLDSAYLLSKLKTYPEMEEQISAWLKKGILKRYAESAGNLFPINLTANAEMEYWISPLLVNIVLHGFELDLKNFAGDLKIKPTANSNRGRATRKNALTVVRHGDAFLLLVRVNSNM